MWTPSLANVRSSKKCFAWTGLHSFRVKSKHIGKCIGTCLFQGKISFYILSRSSLLSECLVNCWANGGDFCWGRGWHEEVPFFKMHHGAELLSSCSENRKKCWDRFVLSRRDGKIHMVVPFITQGDMQQQRVVQCLRLWSVYRRNPLRNLVSSFFMKIRLEAQWRDLINTLQVFGWFIHPARTRRCFCGTREEPEEKSTLETAYPSSNLPTNMPQYVWDFWRSNTNLGGANILPDLESALIYHQKACIKPLKSATAACADKPGEEEHFLVLMRTSVGHWWN